MVQFTHQLTGNEFKQLGRELVNKCLALKQTSIGFARNIRPDFIYVFRKDTENK